MIEKMLALKNSNTSISVMYDVACSLTKYVKVCYLFTSNAKNIMLYLCCFVEFLQL